MKILTLLALFLATSISLFASETTGLSSPESVLVTKDAIYVSNVGAKPEPLKKDKDGFISKLDSSGKITTLKYIVGLDAPKGMTIDSGVLYVTDIDTIKGYDLASKKQVFSLPIKGAKFLNDLANGKRKGSLYLSDSGTGNIYRISIAKKKAHKLINVHGANGLLLDKKAKRLYVAGYDDGTIGYVSFPTKDKKTNKKTKISYTKLATIKGAFDGIAFDKGHNILFSDWGKDGVIYRYDMQTKKISPLNLPKVKGPADFTYYKGYLYIPSMLEGKLVKVELK